MKNTKIFEDLCTPAIIYLVLSAFVVFTCILSRRYNEAFGHTLVSGLWFILLTWLCNMGHSGVSWFILLFPIIFTVLIMILVPFERLNDRAENNRRRRMRRDIQDIQNGEIQDRNLYNPLD